MFYISLVTRRHTLAGGYPLQMSQTPFVGGCPQATPKKLWEGARAR